MNELKNKSKKIVISGAAAILLFTGVAALAQNPEAAELKRGVKTRLEQVREIRAQALEKAKTARENLQKKVGEIKDQKKKEAAEKISNQLERLNNVWTDHFANVLDKLSAVLEKVKSRLEKAKAAGKDVSAVEAAMTKAEQAIEAAKAAVAEQAGKTYSVDTASMTGSTATTSGQNNLVSALRTKFKAAREQMFKDLTALRDGKMKDARKAVQEAIQSLAKVPDINK